MPVLIADMVVVIAFSISSVEYNGSLFSTFYWQSWLSILMLSHRQAKETYALSDCCAISGYSFSLFIFFPEMFVLNCQVYYYL